MSDDRCLLCGHLWELHRHYRRGRDCALCDCIRYRRPRWRLFNVKHRRTNE